MTWTLMAAGVTYSPAEHVYLPPSSALACWMMSEDTVVAARFVSTLTPPRVDV